MLTSEFCLIGRNKGATNTKLLAVTGKNASPLGFFMAARFGSDYTGATALLDSLAFPQ